MLLPVWRPTAEKLVYRKFRKGNSVVDNSSCEADDEHAGSILYLRLFLVFLFSFGVWFHVFLCNPLLLLTSGSASVDSGLAANAEELVYRKFRRGNLVVNNSLRKSDNDLAVSILYLHSLPVWRPRAEKLVYRKCSKVNSVVDNTSLESVMTVLFPF